MRSRNLALESCGSRAAAKRGPRGVCSSIRHGDHAKHGKPRELLGRGNHGPLTAGELRISFRESRRAARRQTRRETGEEAVQKFRALGDYAGGFYVTSCDTLLRRVDGVITNSSIRARRLSTEMTDFC